MSSALKSLWPASRIERLGRIKVRARKIGHVVTVSNRGRPLAPLFVFALRSKVDNNPAVFPSLGALDEAVTLLEAGGGNVS